MQSLLSQGRSQVTHRSDDPEPYRVLPLSPAVICCSFKITIAAVWRHEHIMGAALDNVGAAASSAMDIVGAIVRYIWQPTFMQQVPFARLPATNC